FAWVGSGERLVVVDAELFAQIQRINEVIAAARRNGNHMLGNRLQGLLDGWLYELYVHENLHFDHPDALHEDDVFEGHRDVPHHLFDAAVAFAEYLDRRMAAPAVKRQWNDPMRARDVDRLLRRLREVHQRRG